MQSVIQKAALTLQLESQEVFTKNNSIGILIFSVYKKIGLNCKKYWELNLFITMNLFTLMIWNPHITAIKK